MKKNSESNFWITGLPLFHSLWHSLVQKKTRKRMCMCKNLICIVYVCVTQLLLLLEFFLSGTHTHTHFIHTARTTGFFFFFFLLYVQFDSIGSVPEKVVEKKFKFEFKNHNDIKESAIDHKKIVGPS